MIQGSHSFSLFWNTSQFINPLSTMIIQCSQWDPITHHIKPYKQLQLVPHYTHTYVNTQGVTAYTKVPLLISPQDVGESDALIAFNLPRPPPLKLNWAGLLSLQHKHTHTHRELCISGSEESVSERREMCVSLPGREREGWFHTTVSCITQLMVSGLLGSVLSERRQMSKPSTTFGEGNSQMKCLWTYTES